MQPCSMPAAAGRNRRSAVPSSGATGGTAYRDAEHMLNNHRAIIRDLLQFIIDTGVRKLDNLQWLHVGGRYPDTIVGIGAGMALSKLDSTKPILIMCEVPEDRNLTKVSMRTNERVVERGIDLQQALSDASAEYGGGGGGHKIAAGAYIPKTAEEEFVTACQQDTRRTVRCGGYRSSLTTSSALVSDRDSSRKGAPSSSLPPGGSARCCMRGHGSQPSGLRMAG